jgi:hypothetical protein
MTSQPISQAFDIALQDLQTRTLGRLQSDFARLVYLASTRNYNTGRYEHDGLTFRYSMPVAERVLATAHREVFLSIALRSLEALTNEIQQYIRFESESPEELLKVWTDLEAYRILVPSQDDPLIVKIFRSNLSAALAIVAESWEGDRRDPAQQFGSQLPSPAQ